MTAGHATTEDLRLRNHDEDAAHTVWLNVVVVGNRVFEETYQLAPGEARRA